MLHASSSFAFVCAALFYASLQLIKIKSGFCGESMKYEIFMRQNHGNLKMNRFVCVAWITSEIKEKEERTWTKKKLIKLSWRNGRRNFTEKFQFFSSSILIND